MRSQAIASRRPGLTSPQPGSKQRSLSNRKSARSTSPIPPPPIREYSLIAAGGAVVAGTFVYQLVALGWQRKFLRMAEGTDPGDQDRFDTLRKRVHLARVLLPILYTVGVGSAVTGGALLFLVEPNEDGSATAWVGVRGVF